MRVETANLVIFSACAHIFNIKKDKVLEKTSYLRI